MQNFPHALFGMRDFEHPDVALGHTHTHTHTHTICANVNITAVKKIEFHCLECFQTLNDVKHFN